MKESGKKYFPDRPSTVFWVTEISETCAQEIHSLPGPKRRKACEQIISEQCSKCWGQVRSTQQAGRRMPNRNRPWNQGRLLGRQPWAESLLLQSDGDPFDYFFVTVCLFFFPSYKPHIWPIRFDVASSDLGIVLEKLYHLSLKAHLPLGR